MRLTRKKAIELCILLWTWLAETGRLKEDWPGWKKYKDIWEELEDACWCWFCLYTNRKQRKPQHLSDCKIVCPYYEIHGFCAAGWKNPFHNWFNARNNEDRKKYAKLFRDQIKKLS